MENFKVDQSMILGERKIGVSGMMRVKNDAEFIEQCVESCLPALDELVIVYNDCTDNSPQIIESLSQKYPDKIKSYHYKPKIFAWNLTPEKKEAILKGEIPSENTLAGYYNYALSKTTFKYVMKIDADQIYFTNKLISICDLYRLRDTSILKGITGTLYILLIKICLSISIRLKKHSKIISNKKIWKSYTKCLHNAIGAFKPNISLSGINVILQNYPDRPVVSLGKNVPYGPNILPPYNGEGDHPIFRVSNKTNFIPSYDILYNNLNKHNLSVIEKLTGLGLYYPAGIYWIHLNGCRLQNYSKSLHNISHSPSAFSNLEHFYCSTLYNILQNNNFEMTTRHKAILFDFIHNDIDKNILNQIENINKSINIQTANSTQCT